MSRICGKPCDVKHQYRRSWLLMFPERKDFPLLCAPVGCQLFITTTKWRRVALDCLINVPYVSPNETACT